MCLILCELLQYVLCVHWSQSSRVNRCSMSGTATSRSRRLRIPAQQAPAGSEPKKSSGARVWLVVWPSRLVPRDNPVPAFGGFSESSACGGPGSSLAVTGATGVKTTGGPGLMTIDHQMTSNGSFSMTWNLKGPPSG